MRKFKLWHTIDAVLAGTTRTRRRRRSTVCCSASTAAAGAQVGLGSALSLIGQREGSTVRLEEAAAAYRAALEERTRERVPLLWATTQFNLANVLSDLGYRENGTARLTEAVAAYRAALEERTREREPLGWGQQASLGNVLIETAGDPGVRPK